MRTKIFLLLCLLISFGTFGQAKKNQYLGINILQLPASTLNINYSIEITPFFTPLVDIGYTFNYVKAENIDWSGWLLTSHRKPEYEYPYKIQWCSFDIYKRSGGYLKLGGYFNFRSALEKQHFVHVGIFLTNSIVYESGDMYILYPVTYFEPTPVNHTVIIFGLNVAAGYEFSLAKRLKSNIDFQISLPNNNYLDLYEYRNFIPGMGFKDNENRLYPMLIWNLKYRL
jgi:hypothetical protein